jgi:hypothetical protein
LQLDDRATAIRCPVEEMGKSALTNGITLRGYPYGVVRMR